MEELAADVAEWSEKTFGSRGPVGPLKHLAKEVQEALANPTDVYEYADCLILILDASRRAGVSVGQLLTAAKRKMVRNRARQWPKPTTNEPVEHVRTSAERLEAYMSEIRSIVCSDRNKTYGDPEDNFARIAKVASVVLGTELTAVDVALFLCCLKLGPWLDLAGYAVCGLGVTEHEEETRRKASEVVTDSITTSDEGRPTSGSVGVPGNGAAETRSDANDAIPW